MLAWDQWYAEYTNCVVSINIFTRSIVPCPVVTACTWNLRLSHSAALLNICHMQLRRQKKAAINRTSLHRQTNNPLWTYLIRNSGRLQTFETAISNSHVTCEQLRNDSQSLESYVNRSNFSSERRTWLTFFNGKKRMKTLTDFYQVHLCVNIELTNSNVPKILPEEHLTVSVLAFLATHNLFERTFIKFATTCMIVKCLGNVSNRSRVQDPITSWL